MKSGVCPKCKSKDILVFESTEDEREKKLADFEKIGLLDKIYTKRYVCCNCGFSERYFDDKSLGKLKKKYKNMRG